MVSTFGSLGAQAQALIKDIAKRTSPFVPPSLSHESSWATLTTTDFLDLLSLFKSANGLQLCSVIIFQMTFSLLHLSKLP